MCQFNIEDRQQLADLLDFEAVDGKGMRSDEVQALFVALISGPDEFVIEEQLCNILGERELDKGTEEKILILLKKLAQSISKQLKEATFTDLWLYNHKPNEFDYATWCNAYLYALEITSTDWFAREDEDFEDLFYPIMALAGVYDATETEAAVIHIDAKERLQLQQILPANLCSIHQYWQVIQNTPQTIKRSGIKVGRNDPCPCGSGRKYKACCNRINN